MNIPEYNIDPDKFSLDFVEATKGMTASEVANVAWQVENEGYKKGLAEGHDRGRESGYDDGFEAGICEGQGDCL